MARQGDLIEPLSFRVRQRRQADTKAARQTGRQTGRDIEPIELGSSKRRG